MSINKQVVIRKALGAVVLTVPLIVPITLTAQTVLEEIIVTAQRREQSLQEVPISIETISGQEILKQGYRDIDELSNYSPTVTIDGETNRPGITVRGFGAKSNNETIEQSAPTFVDGVHYGRTAQLKLAFMDLQSVEILKGPQPVYFGQNVISGAFNLTTNKPTAEWEGYLDAEISVNNTQSVEVAFGGPITDTIGIRVSGMFDRSDGYLQDIVTNDKFPQYKNYGGRVILQWSPSEAFQATVKMEYANLHKGADGFHVCKREEGVFNVDRRTPPQEALYLDPPLGVGWDIEHEPLGECYQSNNGLIPSGNLPPEADRIYMGYGFTRHMLVNINGLNGQIPLPTSAQGFRWGNRDPYDFEAREVLTPWNLYLNLTYQFGNGIEIASLTAYDYYYREWTRNVQAAAFYTDLQNRGTDQYSLSQELRMSSPTGGTIEWMFGGYYQNIDLELYSDSLRPINQHPRRYNESYEDAEWKSVFGTVTYNFLEGKASLDLGARYSNTTKETAIVGYGAEWIQSDGRVIPWLTQVNPTRNQHLLVYAGDSVIGMTPLGLKSSGIDGPHFGTADISELNPQISLRYRPNENMSMYAKYAESYKASGFNTALATIPPASGWSFGPEYGTNYEMGIKGAIWDGEARYDVSLFYAKITDLQLASATVSPDNNLLQFNNAGAQRNQGAEFVFDWLATDRLRLTLAGAIMDGVMLDYAGASCTEYEFEYFSETGCDPVTQKIDRTGQQAPNTPDWKFVLTADYRWPLWNLYEGFINAKGYVSDGYINDTTSFDLINKYNQHGDLSLLAGFGPQGGPWELSVFARNILEAHQSYNPEFSVAPPAPFEQQALDRTNFMSYGLRFRYDYN